MLSMRDQTRILQRTSLFVQHAGPDSFAFCKHCYQTSSAIPNTLLCSIQQQNLSTSSPPCRPEAEGRQSCCLHWTSLYLELYHRSPSNFSSWPAAALVWHHRITA